MYLKYFFSLLLLASMLYSQTIETLFEENNYEDACKLADKYYADNPQSYKANLYYAKCADYRGNIDVAMAAYDRADILKEDSNTFSLLAHFSGGVDTNVKYNAELPDMNEWFETDSYSDKPESDLFVKEYLRLTHLYLGNSYTSYYYKNQLHIYNKNYTEFSEEDFTQVELYSGVGWSKRDFDIWLPVSFTYMATEYDSYSTIFAFKPQMRKRFENKLLLKVEAGYEYQKYVQWDEGNKDIYWSNISLSRYFSENYFRLGYNYMKVENRVSSSPRIFVDKNLNEIAINYTRVIQKSMELGFGYLLSSSMYSDVAISTSTQKREDTLVKYSAYMSYNIRNNVECVISYDKYNNSSNYIPSDYTKELYSIGVYIYY